MARPWSKFGMMVWALCLLAVLFSIVESGQIEPTFQFLNYIAIVYDAWLIIGVVWMFVGLVSMAFPTHQ